MMLKGLPASGKSTFARKLADDGWVRVNKDELRTMLHNGKWSSKNEKQVLEIRDLIIKDSLYFGKCVVVDDTNLAPKHKKELKALAKKYGAAFETKFFDVSVEECIERDLKRENSVGSKVIMDMYNQFLKPPAKVIKYDPKLPTAILCDIDGTLAHGIGITRKPYEWDKVGSDTVDYTIRYLLNIYNLENIRVILLSGRDGSCKPETFKWLDDNNIVYNYLYMREAGDNRKDSIVKEELYRKYIEGRFNVDFVLDDRNQVVDMWRSLGLKVFQVADGSF